MDVCIDATFKFLYVTIFVFFVLAADMLDVSQEDIVWPTTLYVQPNQDNEAALFNKEERKFISRTLSCKYTEYIGL